MRKFNAYPHGGDENKNSYPNTIKVLNADKKIAAKQYVKK